MTSRSAVVMPGPPLRGMSSPPATSMTKIWRVDQARGEGRGEVVAAGLDQDQVERAELRPPGPRRLRGWRRCRRGWRCAGRRRSRRRDALGGQDGVAEQELGVLAGVDVVGDDGDGQLVAQRAAQRGDGAVLPVPTGPPSPMRRARRRRRGVRAGGAVVCARGRCRGQVHGAPVVRVRRRGSAGAGQEANRRTGQAACCSAVMSSSGAEARGQRVAPSARTAARPRRPAARPGRCRRRGGRGRRWRRRGPG